MVRFYAVLCVFGAALPYSAVIAWGVENGGLDLGAMLAEIANSRMSLSAWADVAGAPGRRSPAAPFPEYPDA